MMAMDEDTRDVAFRMVAEAEPTENPRSVMRRVSNYVSERGAHVLAAEEMNLLVELRIEVSKRPLDGVLWGRWRFNARDLTLEAIWLQKPGAWHGVDLKRCRTSAEVLDWLCQVQKKSWISNDDVGDLLGAIDDLAGGLQEHMCRSGMESMKGRNWVAQLRVNNSP